MSGSSKCGRCDQTVYPVEGLRCLDKIWHKGCFKCHECNMTLSLKNYKGFDKRPYCNAHCPQAKATTVADTPEIRRLAENTRIQSQAKYHEDFEKSKKKGFTAIADDPETIRIKNTSKIISNAAYHGELERKKQMEEKRSFSGSEVETYMNNNNNNNNIKSSNNNNGKQRVQLGSLQTTQVHEADYPSSNQMNSSYASNQSGRGYQPQSIQQIHVQQQQQFQRQQQHLKQQELIKQQQIMYAKDYHQHLHNQNGAQMVGRQPVQHMEGSMQKLPQQANQQQLLQPYAVADPHYQHQQQQQQQQQQMLMRQHQMMLQQSRQQAIELNRQLPRQNSGPASSQIMKHSQMVPNQQLSAAQNQIKYVPINDVVSVNQMSSPTHMAMSGTAQMINHHHHHQATSGEIPNGQRLPQTAQITGSQAPHHMIGYPSHQQHSISSMNSAAIITKQQQFISPQMAGSPSRQHLIQSSQIQPVMNPHPRHQMIRPPTLAMQHPQMQYHLQPLSSRVFRAMYDYEANDVDEVSFFESDFLVDCVEAGGNWLIGKVARTGQEGMFPANYVTAYSSQ